MTEKQMVPLIIFSIAMLFFMIAGTTIAHRIVHLPGNWSVTLSSFVFPFSFITNVLIAELYKRKLSLTVLFVCLFFSFLFGIIAQDSIPFSLPLVFWGTLGSLISFSVNTYIVTKKNLAAVTSFTIRYLISTTIGEFLLVTIVSFAVFLPHYPFQVVCQIWLFSYFSKVVITLLAAFPTTMLAHFLHNKNTYAL